jgi:hypothetical protein
MADQHPELAVTFMKGMIKVGRWANENKRAAAAILDKQTFYLDVEDTYQDIKHIDMVPNLSAQNLASTQIGKDFMLSHGYINNDFDVHQWAEPQFAEQAAKSCTKSAAKSLAKSGSACSTRGSDNRRLSGVEPRRHSAGKPNVPVSECAPFG